MLDLGQSVLGASGHARSSVHGGTVSDTRYVAPRSRDGWGETVLSFCGDDRGSGCEVEDHAILLGGPDHSAGHPASSGAWMPGTHGPFSPKTAKAFWAPQHGRSGVRSTGRCTVSDNQDTSPGHKAGWRRIVLKLCRDEKGSGSEFETGVTALLVVAAVLLFIALAGQQVKSLLDSILNWLQSLPSGPW
jgi:hypothetical protein